MQKTNSVLNARNDLHSNQTQTAKDPSEEKRHGSFRTLLKNIFFDYSENSSINGMKYIGERQRPWIERTLWILALGISIILCCNFIWSSYKKWQDSPVIVSFADKSTSIWEIPFPAVTICPETKVKSQFLNFTRAYRLVTEKENPNLTETEEHLLKIVYQTCDFSSITPTVFEQVLNSPPENFVNETFVETLMNIAPHIFHFCRYKNTTSWTCDDFFTPILTDEGICYTFNMLNASDIYHESALHSKHVYPNHENVANWTLEGGYRSNTPMQTYPQRALRDGVAGGLYVWMKLLKKDYDLLCRGSMKGLKVLLHSPDEIPQVSKHFFRINLKQELAISVSPNMMTTSDGLKDYEPNRRQCYFNHEPTLKFFKVYSQRNCELECLALFIAKKCGCVKFSMPREEGTPICGAAKVSCYTEGESEFLDQQIINDLSKNTETSHCKCLPSCTSIVYEAETSSIEMDWDNYIRSIFGDDFSESDVEEILDEQPVRLRVYFREKQFIRSKRSELYGLTDFISNCGGLLGLFMGFSILSIVEIIYFCSIRLFCNLRRRNALTTPAPDSSSNNQQRETITRF